jgi:hypothetical protein
MVNCLVKEPCGFGLDLEGNIPSDAGWNGPLNSSGRAQPSSMVSTSVSFSRPSSQPPPPSVLVAAPAPTLSLALADPLLRPLDLGEQRVSSGGQGRRAQA